MFDICYLKVICLHTGKHERTSTTQAQFVAYLPGINDPVFYEVTWYKASFFFCLAGLVGILEPGSLPEFILSINASDASSAIPRTVALG